MLPGEPSPRFNKADAVVLLAAVRVCRLMVLVCLSSSTAGHMHVRALLLHRQPAVLPPPADHGRGGLEAGGRAGGGLLLLFPQR